MPPVLALLGALLFIIWLFVRDRKRGDVCSGALWIPLIWLLIIGSRPISAWFGSGQPAEPGDYQEGSPLDRNVFLALIFAGMIILLRRRVGWRMLASSNRWLFVYFAYLGLSVVWSDFPFIALKRWFKDCGNIVMILLILSEADPERAVRLILARSAYVLIPLSAVVIKYFPDVGRYYNRYTWTYSYGGLTQDKNMMGSTLVLCGLGLFWSFLEFSKKTPGTKAELALGVLCVWLLSMAGSSTATACTLLGVAIMGGMRVAAIRSRVERLGRKAIVLFQLILLVAMMFNLFGALVVGALGRDMTLTGRTEIWQRVLSVDINPLFGVGYYSFWLVKRIDWIALGWMFQLNEAHNGYIETYLNGGWVGLALLGALLITSLRRVVGDAVHGRDREAFLLAFAVILVIYNVSESAFNRLTPIWVIGLLAMTVFPRAERVAGGEGARSGPEHRVGAPALPSVCELNTH